MNLFGGSKLTTSSNEIPNIAAFCQIIAATLVKLIVFRFLELFVEERKKLVIFLGSVTTEFERIALE